MTATSAADITLKIGDGASPSESFTMIEGVQVNELVIERTPIEQTHIHASGYRELAEAGRASVRISAQGVFTDSAAELMLQTMALSAGQRNMQLEFGNANIAIGRFMVTRFERGGRYDEIEQCSFTLQSSGSVAVV